MIHSQERMKQEQRGGSFDPATIQKWHQAKLQILESIKRTKFNLPELEQHFAASHSVTFSYRCIDKRCNESFDKLEDLLAHIPVHSAEFKPYHCICSGPDGKMCLFSACTKQDLITHILEVHQIKVYDDDALKNCHRNRRVVGKNVKQSIPKYIHRDHSKDIKIKAEPEIIIKKEKLKPTTTNFLSNPQNFYRGNSTKDQKGTSSLPSKLNENECRRSIPANVAPPTAPRLNQLNASRCYQRKPVAQNGNHTIQCQQMQSIVSRSVSVDYVPVSRSNSISVPVIDVPVYVPPSFSTMNTMNTYGGSLVPSSLVPIRNDGQKQMNAATIQQQKQIIFPFADFSAIQKTQNVNNQNLFVKRNGSNHQNTMQNKTHQLNHSTNLKRMQSFPFLTQQQPSANSQMHQIKQTNARHQPKQICSISRVNQNHNKPKTIEPPIKPKSPPKPPKPKQLPNRTKMKREPRRSRMPYICPKGIPKFKTNQSHFVDSPAQSSVRMPFSKSLDLCNTLFVLRGMSYVYIYT